MSDLAELLSAAFLHHDSQHERSQQTYVGISDVAGCLRRAAYGFHGVMPDELIDEKRAAALGTWLHLGLLPMLQDVMGGGVEIEKRVSVDGLPGHVDLWQPRVELVTGELLQPGRVVDLKTCSQNAMYRYRVNGPRQSHLTQLYLYAAALLEEGEQVDELALLYVSRDTGELWSYVERLDGLDAQCDLGRATGRWHLLQDSTAPEQIAREERGPGLSVVCDNCPWQKPCWGVRDDERAVQANTLDSADVAETLQQYKDAQVDEASAKRDKEWYRSLLDATPAGTFDGWRIAWGRNKEGEEVDIDSAVLALELAGIDVPMRKTKRRGAISVTKAK